MPALVRRLSALLALSFVPLATGPVLAQSPPDGAGSGGSASNGADPDSAFWAGFEWRSIGPTNFGGRITDVEGIPSPSKTFYVAAATGGIWKTTNNGTTFRPVFDDQRVVAMGDIAVAPSDTSIVWAGTGEEDSRNSISPGGGVYKSTDGGMTWELMGLEDTHAIGRIVIHPENPEVVYVAALGHIWGPNEERGLYRTADGGETWERIHHIGEKAGFVDLAMHPEDPDVMLASSWERVRGPWFLQSGGPGSGLWKTTDGGESWTEVTGGGFPEGMKGRIGIAYAPSDPDVVYALVEAEAPEGEAAPEEGGEETAEAAGAADPAEAGGGEEAGEEEAAREEEDDDEGPSGLYRSEDGGRTWTFMNGENTRPFYYSQVRVDPSDPDRVYWSSTPVRFSKDGGKTVGQATLGIHVDHHAMWWDPADPDRFIVGNDGGVHITWDKGGTYAFLNTIPLGQFYAISLGSGIPYRVCGGLQDNGTWCGPSRLADGGITKHHWYTVWGGDGFYSAQDPAEEVVYAESQGGNMGRVHLPSGQSEGLGAPTWQEATKALRDSVIELGGKLHGEVTEEEDLLAPKVRERIAELKSRISADSAERDLRFNWSTPFLLSPHDRETLYAGANRVLMSANRGDDWDVVSPDLTTADTMKIRVSTRETGGITDDVTGAETHTTITTLDESPLVEGRLLAGTDDGKVWIRHGPDAEWEDLTGRFPGVPENTWVSRVEPSSHDPDRFYVSFDGHRSDDFTPYLFVTEDGGEGFRSLASDLPRGKPDYVHVVREDPTNPDLLFVGTDVGVYVSLDRGESWRRFTEGMPTVPVHDLKVHPRDRELVAGTHGRSIWIVDIAPLQELAGDAMVASASSTGSAGTGSAASDDDGSTGTSSLLEEPVLFTPKPALQYGDRPVGGETPGHRWFSGESPDYGAEIAYWMPAGFGPGAAAAEGEAEPPSVDLSGDWEVSVETPMGTQSSTLRLEMAEDGSLSGRVEASLGAGEVTEGRVAGRSFRLVTSMEMMGRAMEITYAGEAGEDEVLRGTVSFGERFSADFRGGRPGVELPTEEEEGEEGAAENRARIAILDAAGDTVRTLDGPLSRGLHRVYWNTRRETEDEPLSPSERADSLHLAGMMHAVADSFVEAGSVERKTADRVIELFESGDRAAIFRVFGGGGGRSGRGFRERPGESYPETPETEEEPEAAQPEAAGAEAEAAAAAAEEEAEEAVEEAEAAAEEEAEEASGEVDPADLRDAMQEMYMAMRDRGASFSAFQRGDGGSAPADPGTYRVVLQVGERTLTAPLEVVRDPEYVVEEEDAGDGAVAPGFLERLLGEGR